MRQSNFKVFSPNLLLLIIVCDCLGTICLRKMRDLSCSNCLHTVDAEFKATPLCI